MSWEIAIEVYALPGVKQLVGSCSIAQGTQLCVQW